MNHFEGKEIGRCAPAYLRAYVFARLFVPVGVVVVLSRVGSIPELCKLSPGDKG